MAMDLVKTNLRGLLAKIQSTAGTPVALNAANDGFLVSNGEYALATDELEREIDKAGHGSKPYVNVKRRCMYDFVMELRGAATPGNASPLGPLLRAAGFAEALTASTSAIYSLITSAFEMVSIEGYSNGAKVVGQDARGAITNIELSIRNFAKAKASFLALPQTTPIADAAVPAITLSSFQAPVPIETESFEVDIGGTKLNAISVSCDTNAQCEIYEGSESRFVYYREFYRPKGTIRVFKEQRGTWHPENIALAHSLHDVYALITGGGERVRLDLDSCQFGIPKAADVDGVTAWDIPYRAVGSTSTDALKLSFLAPP